MIADGRGVLDFWCDPSDVERWFATTVAPGGRIQRDVGAAVDAAMDSRQAQLHDWTDLSSGWPPLLIRFDPFPRHSHRASSAAWAGDVRVQRAALSGSFCGYDRQLLVQQRVFAWPPLPYAEGSALQQRSVE